MVTRSCWLGSEQVAATESSDRARPGAAMTDEPSERARRAPPPARRRRAAPGPRCRPGDVASRRRPGGWRRPVPAARRRRQRRDAGDASGDASRPSGHATSQVPEGGGLILDNDGIVVTQPRPGVQGLHRTSAPTWAAPSTTSATARSTAPATAACSRSRTAASWTARRPSRCRSADHRAAQGDRDQLNPGGSPDAGDGARDRGISALPARRQPGTPRRGGRYAGRGAGR